MIRNYSASLVGRNAIYRYFLLASTVSLLGSNIFDIMIPIYVVERTHSAMALSLAAAALTLPFLLMAPFTGYTVDRFNKRRVMMGSDLGQIGFMIFLLVFDIRGGTGLWPILLVIFAAKTLMITFETVATFQLIPALVTNEDLTEANTWFLSSQRFIQIVGPVAAGVLMSLLGIRACIIVNALSFSATIYFVYKIKNLNELIEGGEVLAHEPVSLAAVRENFIGSLRYIWRSPLFKPFIFMMFVWNLSSLCSAAPAVTYYFTEIQKFTPERYGTIISLFGVMGIIGYLVSGYFYRRFDFQSTFFGSALWLAVLGTFCLVFYRQPYAFAILLASSRIGGSILSMGTFYLRQTSIPKNKMGGVNACLRMFFMSSAPLSALAQGFLMDRFNVFVTLALGSICLWGTVIFSTRTATAYVGQAPEAADSSEMRAA